MKAIAIYFIREDIRPHEKTEMLDFGVKHLRQILTCAGIFSSVRSLRSFCQDDEHAIVLSFLKDEYIFDKSLEKEGFFIAKKNKTIYITGADEAGILYGILDLAETVQFDGIDAVCDKKEEPFLKKRGIKFNLPFEPYGTGELIEKNKKVVLDKKFWREFIDFLALNRYNCLSLWSVNPFEMMFRLDKYPQSTDYSDSDISKFKDLFTFIFRHAKNRGLETYLFTWNIRLSPAIAKGLSLPEELGDNYFDQKSTRIRQFLPVIKDYFKEAVKTLLITYPDLTGIGTSNSEEMTKTTEEKEQWVAETYLEALHELDDPVPVIHRTNGSSGSITKKLFLDKYHHPEKYISWKYSNAHMYSHPRPQFEELFHAWDDMNFDDIKVMYTVRNDDFQNLRGCDAAFLSEYFKGMKKDYVAGFYWGADGYIWAGEFQHVPYLHQEWEYAFEKHWIQFEMIGRLSWNPNLPDTVWIKKYSQKYGNENGPLLHKGFSFAIRMLCAVNRLFWIHYDWQWHPETLLSKYGFKTILDFVNSESIPLCKVISMKDFVRAKRNGTPIEGETPEDILSIIRHSLDVLDSTSRIVPEPYGDLECALLDIKAWYALGNYYLCKFSAAMKLLEGDKERAILYLEEGVEHWKDLSSIGSEHYLSYHISRVDHVFGWGYYLKDVQRDIDFARNYISENS